MKNYTKYFLLLFFGITLTAQEKDQNISHWKAVSAGDYFTLAIKEDGTLWAWGYNQDGRLGDGTSTDRNIPVRIGNDKWKVISAGGDYSLAIKEDGTLWAWGSNKDGQLGDSTTIDKYSPVQIGNDKWKTASASFAGRAHSLAIKENGTLWTWGSNKSGQLGIGKSGYELPKILIPTQIGNDKWKEVYTGSWSSLGIKEDETLWNWGVFSGNLFDEETKEIKTPLQVGNDKWKVALAGWLYSLGIQEDGTLRNLEAKKQTQLKDGSKKYEFSQIGKGKWKQVSANMGHILAIKEDGSLWACGNNQFGKLGNGTTTKTNELIKIGKHKWKQVSTGWHHSVGIQEDGTLWAWGNNSKGQLGDGTNDDKYQIK